MKYLFRDNYDDEPRGYLDDLIKDEDAESPFDAMFKSELTSSIRKMIGTLTPREERVLRLRFGIGTNTTTPLKEVGRQFDVTPVRIRQIAEKAFRKLRHPSRSALLRQFLNEEE